MSWPGVPERMKNMPAMVDMTLVGSEETESTQVGQREILSGILNVWLLHPVKKPKV